MLFYEISLIMKEKSNASALAYIVKDDIEFGHGNIIPLWCFGLNY